MSETIEDIVRDMRAIDFGIIENPFVQFADRIEAAAKELTAENARLRAALKPVLACDLSKFGDGFCYVDLFESVLEAKRIYNESEVKHEG